MVQGEGFRVYGAGFMVQGSGFGVQGSGCRVCGVRTVRSCAMVRASQASRLCRAASYLGMQVYGQRFGCGEFEGWDMGPEFWGLRSRVKVGCAGLRLWRKGSGCEPGVEVVARCFLPSDATYCQRFGCGEFGGWDIGV